jgi:hypothetical protein
MAGRDDSSYLLFGGGLGHGPGAGRGAGLGGAGLGLGCFGAGTGGGSLANHFLRRDSSSIPARKVIELIRVYEPVRLRLGFETRPRGRFSSKLTIDSDWSIRGGKELSGDWSGPDDTW